MDDSPAGSFSSGVKQIVGAAEKLVERAGQSLFEGIFTNCRKICGHLTV
jgi:hypothetical protein